MLTTTLYDYTPTITPGGGPRKTKPNELLARYSSVIEDQRLSWTSHHRLTKLLGKGGQGVVYLTQRRGADDFTLPVAVKIFSPEHYEDARAYDAAMSRIARVSARVAQIQQDNLLDVQNFVDRHRIRMMEMEWVDGYDLRRLLVPKMLKRLYNNVSERRWDYINSVIVTEGPVQPRIKPGVAVAIVRDCLAALAALHREDLAHGDIKPSNIMLKRTGDAKIVDIGCAVELNDPPPERACTPAYAAPEVLQGEVASPRSDVASLGYVLVELLSGCPIFRGINNHRELLEAKRMIPQKLDSLMPKEVTCNDLLMDFCRGLIAPDPTRRFANAEAADFTKGGAATFHRQLVLGDLAVEYENEIRMWLGELKELDERDERQTDAMP